MITLVAAIVDVFQYCATTSNGRAGSTNDRFGKMPVPRFGPTIHWTSAAAELLEGFGSIASLVALAPNVATPLRFSVKETHDMSVDPFGSMRTSCGPWHSVPLTNEAAVVMCVCTAAS